jgi:hypothetical protein
MIREQDIPSFRPVHVLPRSTSMFLTRSCAGERLGAVVIFHLGDTLYV